MNSELFSVISLNEGEEGVVNLVSGGESLTSRLAGMGIVPGTRIKILRNTGSLIIVLATDTRIALGRGQAEKILVVKVKDTHDLQEKATRRKLLVALAGQPNVGKSTVFNVLTGLSQHVGNWPGKTVEKKEGIHVSGDTEIRIVDLPGTYSLSAFSEEERVARDFVIHEHPDIIVILVNASALERSLYLLSEVLLLDTPVIVAVNMIDVAADQGTKVDIEALANSLKLPVVPMIAAKNKGIKELVSEIVRVADNKVNYDVKLPTVSADHMEIYLKLTELLKGYIPVPYTERWLVTKLMEGDPEITKLLEDIVPIDTWTQIQSLLIKHEDALRAVVGGRYDWIEEIARSSVSRFKRGQILMTDRIDHILTRPIIGIPVLLGILAIIFMVTFKVGLPIQELLGTLAGKAGQWLDEALTQTPWWVRGLVVNGILGGVGSVLTFVPLLVIFFATMAFLESVGYMARAAFVMDRFMHLIGLHGKSFLPMCLGFGCNVPSVLGARIVESKRARLLTIFLTPFVPCTGRLAVLTFISGAIFYDKALMVTWFLVTLNIVSLGVAGMLISKLFLKGEPVPFIMELPLYHKPDLKTIGIVIWNRTMAFVKKAGTVILIFSVVLWAISNIPGGKVEHSLLGWVGHFIEPIGRPLGLDWKLMVALLSSIVAKENAVATLGVLYNVGEQGLQGVLPSAINHASALSFLAVLMLFIPCMPTIAVMKQEMDNLRWFVTSFVFMVMLSYIIAMLIYRLALLVGV
ncbi:MAG TPA: ferrous iron transport protein B [Syntrophorhabdus sp.]|nr:ferrous iron transport protein B [Syntrophorhabdus sp.]